MNRPKPPPYRFCPFCGCRLSVKTEEGKRRSYCGPCSWTYYPRAAMSVSAIIAKRDRVLLVKRRRDPFKGTWMFPAGFVDYGEHPVESVKREVKEETGLEVTGVTLLGVF